MYPSSGHLSFLPSLTRFCLLGFNARAAIFQLYSGDEHEVDDKMNMNDDEMKQGMEQKGNRIDIFWLPLEKGGLGRGGQFSLLWRSAKIPTPIEYHSRVL